MLTDGIQLLGTSTASNLSIESGDTLPTTGNNIGELFYLTGTGLHVFDGTFWVPVASGGGTVTNTSVVTANGISGSVANATTTPAITLTLGAITPTSVAATGTVTGSNLSGTNTGNQTITLTGDVTGSGTGSFTATLASVGTPGTYKSVTTDAKGRVTAGTNPTTLAGYGITDAAPLNFTQTGTGAVARTITNKLQDVVNIKDFGAVGDGTTNDTAAIQAALDTGKLVRLAPGGNYLFSTSLVVPNGGGLIAEKDATLTMANSGFTSALKSTRYGTTGAGILVSGLTSGAFTAHTGAIIKGIKLRMQTAVNGRNLAPICVRNAVDVIVEDNEITNFGAGGLITVDSVLGNSSFSGNYLHDCIENGNTFPGGQDAQLTGIEVDQGRVNGVSSKALRIQNNHIVRLTFGAAALAAYTYQTDGININGSNSNFHIITENRIETVGEGIDCFGQRCTITNNNIDDCYLFGIKLIHGASFNTVSNNVINDTGIAGIILSSSPSATCTQNIVDNNIIIGLSPTAAYIASEDVACIKTYDGSDGANLQPVNNTISNNHCDPGVTGGEYGIFRGSYGTGNIFFMNRIVQSGTIGWMGDRGTETGGSYSFIKTTGTVLFDTLTDNGTSKLQVNGNILATSFTGAAAAGTLSGTTLASNVVTSSLTSVGTLGSLSVGGNITLTTAAQIQMTAAGDFTLNATNATGNIALRVAGVERVRVAGNTGAITATGSFLENGDATILNAANQGNLILSRTEGTFAAPTVVNASTTVGQISFRGYDGAAYRNTALILSQSDGAISNTSSPGNIALYTTPTGSTTPVRQLTLTSAGGLSFGVSTSAHGTAGQVLTSAGNAPPTWSSQPVLIQVPCSDETTALTTGTAKVTFRAPYAFTLTAVRASVNTAPTGGTLLTVDINESGNSVLSTKLTFDASEKTTVTAATQAVISDSAIADDAEISIDIDAVGSTVAGTGLKVTLIGTRP